MNPGLFVLGILLLMPRRTHAERGVFLGGLAGFVLLCVALLEAVAGTDGLLWWSIASLPALVAWMTPWAPESLLLLLTFAGPAVQWGLMGFLIGRAVEGRRRFAGIGMLVFAGTLFLLSIRVYLAPYRWWLHRNAVNGAVYANLAIGLLIWTVGVWLVARNEHVVRRMGPAIGYDAITNQRLPKGDD